MQQRLLISALALPGLAVAANWVPLAGLLLALAAAVLVIVDTRERGVGVALLGVAPGAAVLAMVSPGALPEYAATVLGAVVFARVRAAGGSFWNGLTWGTAPFAVWTLGVALTGWSPLAAVSPEMTEAALRSSTEGMPAERAAEIAATMQRLLEFGERTWVAWQLVWFGVVLAVAARIALRFGRSTDRPVGRFVALEIPDLWIGVLIAGLAAVLLAPGESSVSTVGWNLVLVSGLLFAVRGIAIQLFWMERGGMRVLFRSLYFGVSVLLFAPVFLSVTAALGLFDAWFDFRRQRGEGDGESPLSFFPPSSGDDQRGTE